MAKHMTLDTRKGIAHGLECLPQRGREEDPVQEPEEVLRDVRGLRAKDMPGARARPIRVQRMRQADDLPAPQALLCRRRRAGQLPGHPQGREFLERLGIRRVNAESVVLDPILLGGKFKKEANRAILHRHGVL